MIDYLDPAVAFPAAILLTALYFFLEQRALRKQKAQIKR